MTLQKRIDDIKEVLREAKKRKKSNAAKSGENIPGEIPKKQ